MSGIQRTLLAGNADKIASNFADGVVSGYRAAITAAGGSIGATQLAAVKAFVKTGFKDRWWFSLVDCCLFLGTNLTSALVKIVAAPGAGTSYVPHNLVSGDYVETVGIDVGSSNTTKYIGTGVIPVNVGLALTDISCVLGSTSTFNSQGVWGCDEANSSDIACYGGSPHANHGNRADAVTWSRSYSVGFAAMPSQSVGAVDGIRIMDFAANTSTGAANTEIEMLRTTKFGVKYISTVGHLGFFSIGKHITMQQVQSMTAAVLRLHRAARSIAWPARYVYLGDSITHGQGLASPDLSYPVLVATARSSEATSIAITGSTMMADAGGGLAGRNRYRGTETFPIAKFFCMMGSNDITGDATGTGDTTLIANYRAALVTMANVLKGQGAQVLILSIPYTTRVNQTVLLAWVDGALGAASDAGVTGIDTCRTMIATGTPGQYLQDDVHLNASGHSVVANLILAVI